MALEGQGSGWCPQKGEGVRGQVHMGLTGSDWERRPPHSRQMSPNSLPGSNLQQLLHASSVRPDRPAEGPTAPPTRYPHVLALRRHRMSRPVTLRPCASPFFSVGSMVLSSWVCEGTSVLRRLALCHVSKAPYSGFATGLWFFPLGKKILFLCRDVRPPFVHRCHALCTRR